MEGYTSHIFVAAPITWWPSLRTLHSYPLDPARSFMASCSEAEMPLPSEIKTLTKVKQKEEEQEQQNNICNYYRSVGLSRLGRSLFALAELVHTEKERNLNSMINEHSKNNKSEWAVKVFNPFSQRFMYFEVCHVPLHMELTNGPLSTVITSNKTNMDKMHCYDLIRLLPETINKKSNVQIYSSNHVNTLLFASSARVLWSKIASTLLCDRESEEHQEQQEEHEEEENGTNSQQCYYATSVFIDGDADVCDSFCHALLTHAEYQQEYFNFHHKQNKAKLFPCKTEYVCEVRELNFNVLCRLDEREVLHNIHAAFTPIPVEICNSNDTMDKKNTLVQPIVFIILHGIELLTSSYTSENSHVPLMVSVICYALCYQIDHITEDNVNTKFVILTLCNTIHGFMSARELNKQLPPSLASRLLNYNFYLPRGPCMEDLSRWLEIKYNSLYKKTLSYETVVNKMSHYSFTEWLSIKENQLKCVLQEVQTENWENNDMKVEKEEYVNVYAHLFGLDDVIETVEQLLIWPLQHLSVLHNLQIDLPRGLLLCGSAGTGKTSLMKALADRLTLINRKGDHLYINVMMIDALSLLTKEVGSSEKNIAHLFAQARRPFAFHSKTKNNNIANNYCNNVVTVLFIDNLDSLAPPRQRESESGNNTTTTDRTLSTLLMEMDGVASQRSYNYYHNENSNCNEGINNNNNREEMCKVPVMIIAAAPSIDSLDPAIIRPGRLDIHCNLPSFHSIHFMSGVLTNQILDIVTKLNVIITNSEFDEHDSIKSVTEENEKEYEKVNVTHQVLERCILQELQEQLTQHVKQLSAAQYMAVLRDVFIELFAKMSTSKINLTDTMEQVKEDNVKHTIELDELMQLLQHALSKV